MATIETKAPTRVDLAGGTLDLWPLYAFLGDCFTTNVAISIFTHARLTERKDLEISFTIRDLKAQKTWKSLEACLADSDERFVLLRAHTAYWRPKNGFDLETWSESPIGGGLGGSSSLCVSIHAAFSKWLKKDFSPRDIVEAVHNIEAWVLKMPTGTQDYYPPILGGLNVLKYSADGCDPGAIGKWQGVFDDSFLLVYTGKPHHSGFNNWQVLKDAIDGKSETLSALKELQVVADDMKHAVEQASWSELPDLFNREYDARVRISRVFTSPEIERLKETALSAGALAVKICGAGGGGCVLVWTRPGEKANVSKVCRNAGFQVLEAKPVEAGLTVV